MSTRCAKCGDTGSYEKREKESRLMSDGSTWEFEAFLTIPCECRRELPPRDGKATWWSLERVYERDVIVGVDTITVAVRAEVPMSADGYRVHRYGNRYYPTMIDVEEWPTLLLPDDVRKLAAVLIEAADVCDRIDAADCAPCGHWAPCECGKTRAS